MTELDLVEDPTGRAVLAVRAAPGASREGIAGVHDGTVKVAVTAPAERGRANDRIVRVLAKALGLPRSSITLIAGATSRNKRFAFALAPDQLRQRLDELLS